VAGARRWHRRHDRDRPRAAHAEEKTRNDIWSVDCGFPGVETQMPLMLTESAAGRFSICDYVRWSAFNPARIWGLYPRKGRDRAGRGRHIAIVDLARSWTIDDSKIQSRSKISPWHGRAVKGLPIHTLVRGRFVMRDRALVGARGWGRSVHRIQEMPAPCVRNADLTMQAILAGPREGACRMNAMVPTPSLRCRTRMRSSSWKKSPSPTAAPSGRSMRSPRPACASRRAIFVALSARRAAASRPFSAGDGAHRRLDRSRLCVGPRGRRRADAGRHGVPEPDPAALDDDPRHVMLPLKIVPPFRSEFRAKRKTEFRDRAEALLAQVGLKGFGDKFPWQLSGGMMQRASLCRALVHDPQLLMLDEPFGALDQFTREELWAIMQDLWQSRRPTVLLVTHDLKEAGYLANRICVMQARPAASSTTAWCRSRAAHRRDDLFGRLRRAHPAAARADLHCACRSGAAA